MAVDAPQAAPEKAEAPRYQPLVIVLAAACAGIVIDRYWPLPAAAWWTAAIVAWAVWLVCWRRQRLRTAAVMLLLAVAATAAFWHHCQWYLFAEDDLGYCARSEAQPACVEVLALQTPRIIPPPPPDPMLVLPTGPRCRLEVFILGVRDRDKWQPSSGRARLDVSGYLPDVQAGDRLKVYCHLASPLRPQNPGEFDQAAFLRTSRQRSRLHAEYAQGISVVQQGASWSPRRLIEQIRTYGDQLLARHLDARHRALAATVLLGRREEMEPERKEAFMETGTIHILVVAGLHVGILAMFLTFLAMRLGLARRWALCLVAGTIFLYMLLVDVHPPVVRATALVLMSCWALLLGRATLSFNSLAAGGLLVLVLNPADLFDVGAQLSFLSVAGLSWFASRWMDSAAEQDPLVRLIRENQGWLVRTAGAVGRKILHLALVSATIGLLTWPLVMARFHVLSLVALVMNTLVWIPMSVGLVSGFAVLVLGSIAWPLGSVCGLVCQKSFWLMEGCVTLGQNLPLSHFWVPGPPDWWLIGFYGALALMAAEPRLRPPRRWCAALLALWVAIGLGASGLGRDSSRLRCTFLSMGHGCAVVAELPSGQTLLYDAGRMGAPFIASRSIAGFLWSRGITHLDAVVLSHGDLDHYSAMPELLEKFSVGGVYISPVMFENPNPALDALKEAVAHSGRPFQEIRAGDRLRGGAGCTIEVLHPPKRGVLGSDNANSLVLAIEYHGRRILLTGDLESPGLDDVLAEEPHHCDVLLAPHHGSQRSNAPQLARWCTPAWVVISGSHRWDSRPVTAAYEKTGSRVLHTADSGAVEAVMDGSGIKVSGFLAP